MAVKIKNLTNIAWLSVDTGGQLIVGFLIGGLVARYLGPSALGDLSFAIALMAIFSSFSDLGTNSIAVREILATRHAGEVLGTLFSIKLFGSIIAILLTLAFISVLPFSIKGEPAVVIVVALTTLFQGWEIIDFWFQAQVSSKWTVWARLIALLISAALNVTFVCFRFPLIYFAWAIPLAAAVKALCLSVSYRLAGGGSYPWRFSFKMAKGLVQSGILLMFCSVMKMAHLRFDQILLPYLSDSNQLGIYSVAVRLSEALYFVPAILYMTYAPAVLTARQESLEAYEHEMKRLYSKLILGSYLAILPSIILVGPITSLIFGAQYQGATPAAIIRIISLIFVSLGLGRSAALIAENRLWEYFFCILQGAICNVILDVILIPAWGGTGAAWASLVSLAVTGYFSSFLNPKLWNHARLQTEALLWPRL